VEIVIGSSRRREHDADIEMVERKGIGHPDTICDALAEQLSVELSRFYLERFGSILHHNVDKALLRGGVARARFGGGEVVEPMEVYLAGRAIAAAGGVTIPVEEIAVETARSWLGKHFHALDPIRHVRVHCLVRPGSLDLKDLFGRRGQAGVPLANDTSFGVGFAPLSPLERFTVELERDLNSSSFIAEHPAHGEDVKIMAVRRDEAVSLTVARAFVGPHVPSLEAYLGERRSLEERIVLAASTHWPSANVRVNAADAPDGSAVYLTVTGTSAESGDDGEVGRGNRSNGLITPYRPMSLEALCGKNSVSHVGKLYNILSNMIAETIVANIPAAESAECYLVSQIGAPIDEPAFAHVRIGIEGDTADLTEPVEDVVRAHLADLPTLWRRVVAGTIRLF
jgi:S-adenosylmethionine synthetase